MRLHVICERDVGLFSLIQQVIANLPWAEAEGRTPVAFFGDRTCYWHPEGYRGRDTVWEYYFEPLDPAAPAAAVPDEVREALAERFPSAFEVGYPIGDHFVSAHFGDHPELEGRALSIPYLLDDPDDALRRRTAELIRRWVRVRPELAERVEAFERRELAGHHVVGAHVRGTDAVSPEEARPHRQGSLRLEAYREELERLLAETPANRVFVATDDQASLEYLAEALGRDRVVAHDSLRHDGGEAAGAGPTGWIMPAYIADDPARAARNGEEAVVESLLLGRCRHLVHNGGSLARTVLLAEPDLPHTNTHQPHRRREAG